MIQAAYICSARSLDVLTNLRYPIKQFLVYGLHIHIHKFTTSYQIIFIFRNIAYDLMFGVYYVSFCISHCFIPLRKMFLSWCCLCNPFPLKPTKPDQMLKMSSAIKTLCLNKILYEVCMTFMLNHMSCVNSFSWRALHSSQRHTKASGVIDSVLIRREVNEVQ